MHFANPQFLNLLWLTPVLAVCFWWSFHQRRKALYRFAEKKLADQLIRGVSRTKKGIKAICLLLFFSLAVLALGRPQWGTKLESVKRKGIDLVICIGHIIEYGNPRCRPREAREG